jgi:AraC family transcriptional regulator of adaptative response/methylated-DNA-[protein]-cysteine methyltransferase
MNRQYELVAEALQWLVNEQQNQPQLADLAAHCNLSEAHLQRTFQDYAGVSPKQFLKYLTKEQAMERLRSGETVLDAAVESGLSGPGRLHDLLITTEAISPGEARRMADGVVLRYGVNSTPFGPALIAWSDRGITFLAFCNDKNEQQALAELQAQWPAGEYVEDQTGAQVLLNQVFDNPGERPLKVWLRGSPFQLKVWEALLSIPAGTHCTYGQIASHLKNPNAGRAVGTAIGRNPISWLIPCHRVITSMGTAGGYRWGISTKMAMIGIEAALDTKTAEAA